MVVVEECKLSAVRRLRRLGWFSFRVTVWRAQFGPGIDGSVVQVGVEAWLSLSASHELRTRLGLLSDH